MSVATDPLRRLLLPALPRHRGAAAGLDGPASAPARPRGHRALAPRPTAASTTMPARRPTVPAATSPGRRTCSSRGRECAGTTESTRCSTPTPTPASPHPLSRVVVPEALALAWAPFARRLATRLQRERGFDCVITTSPPESAHTVGRAVQQLGVPWIADIRDAWTFEPLRPAVPDRDPAPPRPPDGAAPALGGRRGGLRQPARGRRSADAGDRRPVRDPERLGPGPRRRRPDPRRRRPGCSTPSGYRSSTPGGSAATGAIRSRSSRRSPRSPARTRAAASRLELVIAGPLTDAEPS